MRRIILSFVLLQLLFASGLSAKERYKVHIIQPKANQKSWGIVGLMVGDFVFDIVASTIANTQSVTKIANDIEEYINRFGLDEEQIVHHFGDRVKLSIIERFHTDRYTYRTDENIKLDISLKQDAYIYLVNLSKDKACIVFPNGEDSANHFKAHRNYSLPSGNYALQANTEGNEEFYLITSMRKLNLIKRFGNSQCTQSQREGSTIISNLRREKLVDIGREDLSIRN